MDSLSGIAVFVQVAETRSFVAAGRLLGISASAVGKSIARLEEKLGVRLFHRSTRSINLTAEGTLFLDRCRRILCEAEAAELELSSTSTQPRGRLRVSMPILSGRFLLPILSDFMRKYPAIELDLDFSDRLVDVIEEGFDAVIRSGEPNDSRLRSRSLSAFRLVLVGAPDYFAKHGKPKYPHELSAHACLHYKFPSTGKLQKWSLKEVDASKSASWNADLRLPNTLICNSGESLLYMTTLGHGIAYLPDFAVRDALADGTLQTVLDEYNDFSGIFRILWPSSRHPSPKLRALIDYLDENLMGVMN